MKMSIQNLVQSTLYLIAQMCEPSIVRTFFGISASLLSAALLALRPILFYHLVGSDTGGSILPFGFGSNAELPFLLLCNEALIIILRFSVELFVGRTFLQNADNLRTRTLKGDLEVEHNTGSGEIYSLVTQQIDLMKSSILNGAMPLITGTAVLMSLFLLNLSHGFVLTTLSVFVAFMLFSGIFITSVRVKKISNWLKSEESKSEFIQAALSNRTWLRLNSYASKVLDVASSRFNRASSLFFQARLIEISGISLSEATIAVIAVGSLLINGHFTKGDVILLIGVLMTASAAITGITSSLNSLSDGIVAAGNLRNFHGSSLLRGDILETESDVCFVQKNNAIFLERVSWNNGSMSVELGPIILNQGAITWVKGPSGSGKTVLLRVLAANLREKNIKCEYYNHLSMFVENAFGLNSADKVFQDYVNVAEISRLVTTNFENPEGLPNSLGERQRMHLAKIVFSSAHVVILDETMNGLPLDMQIKILTHIVRDKRLSVIVCSHNDLSSIADNIIEPQLKIN